MLRNLVSLIDKKASWKKTGILFLLVIMLAAAIITQFFGVITLNPNAAMDSLTFYSSNTFYENVAVQGPAGRQGYLYLHVIDYFFMVFLGLFLISLLYMLVKKVTHSAKLRSLALLPLLSFACDFCENLCIDISLIVYPNKIPVLGSLSGYCTAGKMYTLYIVFSLILILFLLVFIKALKQRNSEA